MNAHTLSRDLLASMSPRPALTVPAMIERLEQARLQWNALADELTVAGSRREQQVGDEMSELDARKDILTIAIRAAVDLALEPLGLTHDTLRELDL